MRYFPNLKATTLSSYNFFWGVGGLEGGIGGIYTFSKKWVQVWGEYFLQFGVTG